MADALKAATPAATTPATAPGRKATTRPLSRHVTALDEWQASCLTPPSLLLVAHCDSEPMLGTALAVPNMTALRCSLRAAASASRQQRGLRLGPALRHAVAGRRKRHAVAGFR
jgi:hypothetical protein